MTIGDYWGIEKHHSGFDPKDGVSVVLVNSEAGERLFDRVKDGLHYEKSDVAYAIERNSLVKEIGEGHVRAPAERYSFFQTLRNTGWNKADKRFLKKRKMLLWKQRVAQLRGKLLRLLKN